MILDRLGKELIYFDGGTGTLLQERGLKPGELPETWSLERADDMIDIARQYYEAGSDIVLSNTFGANALKFHDSRHELDEIVKAAIENVRKGAKLGVKDGRETYVGLDIGPTGKLLKPMGDLDFEDAYQAFAEVARLGEEAGADLIHIETMSDTYEVKAAVLAAKENTSLPCPACSSWHCPCNQEWRGPEWPVPSFQDQFLSLPFDREILLWRRDKPSDGRLHFQSKSGP